MIIILLIIKHLIIIMIIWKETNIAATLLKIQERKTAKGNAYAVLKLTDLTSVLNYLFFQIL